MRFLVDENLSKNKKSLVDHRNLKNVKDEIDGGVSDERIIECAKGHGRGIYTRDKGCALLGLIAGVIVWYRDQETRRA